MWRRGERTAVLHLMQIEHGFDAAYLAVVIASSLTPMEAADFREDLGRAL
jgi:hypothetical protein